MTGLEGQSFHGVAKLTLHTRETYKNASHHCCTDNQKIRVTPENRKTGHVMGCNLRDMLLALKADEWALFTIMGETIVPITR